MSDSQSTGIKFGLTRLILINSGTYLEGHIPLDAAVSFCGPNNFGKSTGINALQFLLVPDLKGAQFEEYTIEESRKFYFPSTSSFILVEINTPTGTCVLGAAGLGPAQLYKFEHFTYQAPLDIAHYLNEDKSISNYADFKRNMLVKNGVTVSPLKSSDVARALCGADNEKQLNLGLVPVGSLERFKVFQRLWLSVITQKQIKASDIKHGLLQVFSLALSAHNEKQFEELRTQAFSDYDKQLIQLNALRDSGDDIHLLSEKMAEGDSAVWELHYLYLYIEANTATVRIDLEDRASELNDKIKSVQERQEKLQERLNAYGDKKEQHVSEITKLETWLEQHREDVAKKESTLWTSTGHILSELESAEGHRDSLAAMVKTSGNYTLASVRETFQSVKRTLDGIQALIDGDPVLYTVISQHWQDEAKADIGKLFGNEVFILKVGPPGGNEPIRMEDSADLFDVLDPVVELIDNGLLKYNNFELDLNALPAGKDLSEFDQQQLESKKNELLKEVDHYQGLINTLEDLEEVKGELQQAKQRCKEITEGLDLWRKVEGNENRAKDDAEKLSLLEEEKRELGILIEDLTTEINQISTDHAEDIAQAQELNRQLSELTDLERQIHIPLADWPEGVPISNYSPDDNLLSNMRRYIQLFSGYRNLVRDCESLYMQIQNRGYRSERSFESDLEGYNHLLQVWDAIEEMETSVRNQRLAGYYTIGAHYQGYLQDYDRLDDEINKLNRVLRGKQISNLKEFKILIKPNEKIVNSLKAIVEASGALESGATGNLNFEGVSVDEDSIEAAIKLIHRAVSNSDEGDIRLEDLFEVGFHTVNKDGNTHVHETLDKVGSTGTRLPLKILTMMFLMTHMVNSSKGSNDISLPYTIDEAADLDPENGRALIESSRSLGFVPLLTSVNPVDLASYAIDLSQAESGNGKAASLVVKPEHWWAMERKEQVTGGHG